MSTTRRPRSRTGVRARGSVVGVTAGEGARDDRLDAVIGGGGASGLSLACHLAAAGWLDHVLVIDDGSIPLEVRGWVYWSRGDGLLDPAASPGVVPIGARAGRVRASTGYGYDRIQWHSAAIARSLVRHGHPFDVAPRPGPHAGARRTRRRSRCGS